MKINSIIIDSTKTKSDLCILGTKYPTDKSPYSTENTETSNGSGHRHPYTAVYDLLFSQLRYKKIKLAEIGILNNMSMLCWREYFPNAELYGFEFNTTLLSNAKSANLKNTIYDFIDIKDENSLSATLPKYGKYDIIIEDSTHIFEDQVRLIKLAHNYLNSGGILVIEDIFRIENEERYNEMISDVKKYYSLITFINTEHDLKYSPNWNNDKLLIFIRNDYNSL